MSQKQNITVSYSMRSTLNLGRNKLSLVRFSAEGCASPSRKEEN